MSENSLYSSHIFMFPFRFDWVNKKYKFKNEFDLYKDNTIEERVNLKELKKDIKDEWGYEQFDLKKDLENKKGYMYNEFAYFYDYARDAIYNQSDDEPISYYFEKKVDSAIYEIDILNDKTYRLDIVGLSLRIFTTGVGILSIELENKKYSGFSDILKINDFGRRIYPQFITTPPKLKFIQNDLTENYNIKFFDIKKWCIVYSTNKTKESFLADKITITGIKKESIKEPFLFKPDKDIKIGNHIMELLGKCFTQEKGKKQKYYIQPILDDRMFVLSWYGNNAFSNQLVGENYITNDDWYKYVFVDGKDKTVFSPTMQTELIKNATYDRWMNYKYGLTLYGVSRYSFVCLSTSDFPKTHMHTMYFQMVTLLLATRASILRFSDEIAAIASSRDIEKLEELYAKYLTFYNRLYFKEVTHQDQGIELYDMARKQMNIDSHIEKLDNKFTKLFEFSNLQSEKINSDKMDRLTIMGAVFLPPSLLVALFSMGIFEYEKSAGSLMIGLIATFSSGLLGYFAIKNMFKRNNNG